MNSILNFIINGERKIDKHGLSKTRAYHSWKAMIRRCYNPLSHAYKDYGQRGIIVCERWHDVRIFFKDMGERPKGLTLERINNNGNYEPNNCKWATKAEQNGNNSSNKYLTFKGETHTIAEWGRITGISRKIIRQRIYISKWSIEMALTTPINSYSPSRHMIEWRGKCQSLTDWSKEYNIDRMLLDSRINKLGWSLEKSLITPVRKNE